MMNQPISLKSKLKGFVSKYSKSMKILGAIGTIAGALSILPYLGNILDWFGDFGTVELDGSYANEKWRKAKAEDFNWLESDWYYPTLRTFYSRYKIENGELYRQNEDNGRYSPFKTEWILTHVHISDKKLLRLNYEGKDWGVNFIRVEDDKKLYYREFERYIKDNGEVYSDKSRLVLNKNRCTMSTDGYTFDCE